MPNKPLPNTINQTQTQTQPFTSALSSSSIAPTPRSTALLPTLPTEILLAIISHLDRVTSCCLGLSSFRLYLIHFSLHGKVGKEEATTWLVEVEEGPWAGKGRMGWQVLGPMTIVCGRTLGEMVRFGGGMGERVWDAGRGWFRRIEGGIGEEKEKEVKDVKGEENVVEEEGR
jgi:hypothetical protein